MEARFANSGAISHGLVALDLSGMDFEILNYLKFLAGHLPVQQLRFLHVLPEFDVFRSDYFQEMTNWGEAMKVDEAAWSALVREVTETFGEEVPDRYQLETVAGRPLEVLLAMEKEWETDLLVLGDKDRASSPGVLKKNILRKARQSVLLVPQNARRSLDRIMVAVDFSDNAKRALETAMAIGKQMPAHPEIICLNVYEMPLMAPYMVNRTVDEFQDMIEGHVQDALLRFTAPASESYPGKISHRLQEKTIPRVSHYIKEAADAENAGLIVIGAKGHSRLERLVLGSVTERLVSANQRVPVLVVK